MCDLSYAKVLNMKTGFTDYRKIYATNLSFIVIIVT